MRILIFSDLHANWDALEALMSALPDVPDAVLFLGDAVGFGPEPAACVAWLQKHMYAGVRGNHEQALLASDQQSWAAGNMKVGCAEDLDDEARATLRHTLSVLGDAHLAFLRSLPETATLDLDGACFFMAHGTPLNPLHGSADLLLSEPRLREMLAGVEADVVLLGHTHVPALRQVGRTLIINPGSLGQPRQGMPDGTFALWEDGRVQIRHLHYDHAATERKLALLPLSGEHMLRLQQILATGMVVS